MKWHSMLPMLTQESGLLWHFRRLQRNIQTDKGKFSWNTGFQFRNYFLSEVSDNWPSPNCDHVWRWGFWEVIRVWRKHDTGILVWQDWHPREKRYQSSLSVPVSICLLACLFYSLCMHWGEFLWVHSKKVAICKLGTDHVDIMASGFQPL